MEDKYAVRSKKSSIYVDLQDIIGYNADLQIYKLKFMECEVGVKLPVKDAKSLKANWQKAQIKIKKRQDPLSEQTPYHSFSLVHPLSGKEYPLMKFGNPFNQFTERNETRSDGEDYAVLEGFVPTTKAKTNEKGRNRALIFATNIYDSFGELVNPILDGNTIASELKSNYAFECEIVENASLHECMNKLRDYAKKSYNSKDNLLIFFAGHGIYDNIFKEGYIISTDSKSDDAGKTSYLSHSNLRTVVNNIPCPHTFLVLDVCFGGTFDPLIASKGRAADLYGEISNEEFITRKAKYKTHLYLTSGGKEYVPDGRPGHHSPFARKFIEALRDYGGKDGILTVNEIIQFIEKVEPQARFGEFGDNEPGSDFLLKSVRF